MQNDKSTKESSMESGKMNFHVLTLFPDMIMEGLHTSILGRSMETGLIRLNAVNIRDYTLNKHKKVDDYPYGGGAGMLMQAQPIYDAWLSVVQSVQTRRKTKDGSDSSESGEENAENAGLEPGSGNVENGGLESGSGNVENGDLESGAKCAHAHTELQNIRTIYLTPQGKTFDQSMAKELSKEEDLIFLCGHYEGVDERVLDEIVTDFVSIGDYVLTGGELPAMVMIDAISRMVKGVLGNQDSGEKESFSDYLLEYPQYSRPESWHDKKVPEILLSGNHAKVEEWRLEQSLARTKELRPELYEKWALEHQEYFIRKEKREKRQRRKT